MKNLIYFFLLLLIVEASAIPRFALMRGVQCKDCHYNPTGGIIRNEDGWKYGKNNLRMFRSSQSEISPAINENISFGLDFRMQYLYSQEKKKSDFQNMALGIYSNIKFSDDINFILEYGNYFQSYGILNILPFEGYIKAGYFSPNFGIKLDDHTAYTRNGDGSLLSSSSTKGLIFRSDYLQTGIELGFFPTDFSFITISAGQDKFPFSKEPVYIGSFELTPSINSINLKLGSSYGVFRNFDNKFNLMSFFGGIGFNRFSLLGEFVVANDYVQSGTKSQALMVETSYRILRGLDFVARYDRWIKNTEKMDEYSSHIILGFDFYPFSFVEIKSQYRLYLENPKIDKNNSFVLQFHFYY